MSSFSIVVATIVLSDALSVEESNLMGAVSALAQKPATSGSGLQERVVERRWSA